jgi:hypothetical protein
MPKAAAPEKYLGHWDMDNSVLTLSPFHVEASNCRQFESHFASGRHLPAANVMPGPGRAKQKADHAGVIRLIESHVRRPKDAIPEEGQQGKRVAGMLNAVHERYAHVFASWADGETAGLDGQSCVMYLPRGDGA